MFINSTRLPTRSVANEEKLSHYWVDFISISFCRVQLLLNELLGETIIYELFSDLATLSPLQSARINKTQRRSPTHLSLTIFIIKRNLDGHRYVWHCLLIHFLINQLTFFFFTRHPSLVIIFITKNVESWLISNKDGINFTIDILVGFVIILCILRISVTAI